MPDEQGNKTDAEKLVQVQAELDASTKEVASLKQEAAQRRVAGNAALKNQHVLNHVVRAHNIDFDVATYDMGKLEIEDGKVVGEVEYKPAGTSSGTGKGTGKPATGGGGSSGSDANVLTKEAVGKMDRYQIMEKWDEVSKVLAS